MLIFWPRNNSYRKRLYLKRRAFSLKVNNSNYCSRNIQAGVPDWRLVSTWFLSLYINNIPYILGIRLTLFGMKRSLCSVTDYFTLWLKNASQISNKLLLYTFFIRLSMTYGSVVWISICDMQMEKFRTSQNSILHRVCSKIIKLAQNLFWDQIQISNDALRSIKPELLTSLERKKTIIRNTWLYTIPRILAHQEVEGKWFNFIFTYMKEIKIKAL